MSITALTATMTLDPDMDNAAISGRNTKPNAPGGDGQGDDVEGSPHD